MPDSLNVPLGPSPRSDIRRYLTFGQEVLRHHHDLDSRWAEPVPVSFGSAAEHIRTQAERFDEPFRLSVVGEFKAGKSALINALVGRPGLVPEGKTPTTGAVIEIRWSRDEGGEVIDRAGNTVFAGSLAETVAYADQRSGPGRTVSGLGVRVLLRIDADAVRNLIIIDTPGLGANEQDDETTVESLALADAAILVINGMRPGSDESVLLAERLRLAGRKMVAVVTRMDRVGNPAEALDGTSEVFREVIDGEPIGVESLRIQEAFREAGTLGADPDAESAAKVAAELAAGGYFDLRDRVQESLLTGAAAGQRIDRVLTDVVDRLHGLNKDAARMAGVRRRDADAFEAEKSEIIQRITHVLTPKRPFINERIEEIVYLHVGEYIADLAEALDVFIDQVADGGLELGFEALVGWVDTDVQDALSQRLVDRFKHLFPDSHADIAADRISRAVASLMELEWQEVVRQSATDTASGRFEPTDLVEQITRHLRGLVVGLALDTFLFGLLFVPGGFLFELGVLAGTLGVGARVHHRGASRRARIKRQARVQLSGVQKHFAHELAGTYFAVNEQTFEELVARAKTFASEKERAALALTAEAERWRSASEQLGRLIADARQLDTWSDR